jgi:hypothetical protein
VSYQFALERLLAYEPKRLVRGWYELATGSCCVVGAIILASRRFGIYGIESVLMERDAFLEIMSLGLTPTEVIAMQDANDSFPPSSTSYRDEERYQHMVEWLRRRVGEEQS